MFKTSILLAAVLAAASAVSAATISTPTALVQCQPVLLTWQGATGKVYLTVLPGKETTATPLVSLPVQDAGTSSYLWTPTLAAGTTVTLAITDGTGVTNYSDTVTVRAGTDSSCLNSNGSTASTGSSSGSSGSTGSSASTGSSGSSSSGSSSSSPSSSGAASSPSSSNTSTSSNQSASTQKSGAASNAASMVGTGLAVAAVALAVFA